MIRERHWNLLQFNKAYLLFYTFYFLFVFCAFSQVKFYDAKTQELYEITRDTDKEIIQSFLNEQNAIEIQFNPFDTSWNAYYPFRLKNKKGNWWLVYQNEDILTNEFKTLSEDFSFDFPTLTMANYYLIIAHKNDRKYLASILNHLKVFDELWFDEVQIFEKEGDYINYKTHLEKLALRRGEYWANAYFSSEPLSGARGEMLLLSGFHFSSVEDLPTIEYDWFEVDRYRRWDDLRYINNFLLLNPEIDILESLGSDVNFFYSQNEVLSPDVNLIKVRNGKTKKWSLVCDSSCGLKNLPSECDEIILHTDSDELMFFDGNQTLPPLVFEVKQNDNVTFLNKEFKQLVTSEYQEFRFVIADNGLSKKYGCALKSNENWYIYDCINGKLIHEVTNDSLENLNENWFIEKD